jgi:hypothetical protein
MSSDSETEHRGPASIGGLESVVVRNAPMSPDMVGRPARSHQHRDFDALNARLTVWDGIANKQLPPEETDMMIRLLEKRAEKRIVQTWIEANPSTDLHEAAITLRVGLTFMPGADRPQVNRLEQQDMSGQKPDQRDPRWRVHTAGLLLSTLEVTKDLSIVQKDQTAEIAKKARARVLRNARDGHAPPSSSMRVLTVRGRDYEAVNIDSNEVYIVNDLRENRGEWDLESTLIEVDGSSLVGLIINYRNLIHRGGPEMSFDDTKKFLDIMIEDARRVCVRSPILFRMSTRSSIIHSKNTRYGVNNGSYFQTITTSKGIAETILLSASYFNSLEPGNSSDSNTAQNYIRPRFLQMIILLLSLLNDDDLVDIADFLESTYRLKANRQHLELLFLKVMPLMSINSKVFLNAMIPAYEGFPLNQPMQENLHSHYWNTFVQRILNQGYLLPGTVDDLGSDEFSWIVKWPEEGFRSSDVFNSLQFTGSNSRTFNDIPPVDLHPEANLKEVTVQMTNNQLYGIDSCDLERITCMNTGIYSTRQARLNGRLYDLEIEEFVLNDAMNEAISILNGVIRRVNWWLTSTQSGRGAAGAMVRRLTKSARKDKPVELVLMDEQFGPGRLTKNRALLNHDIVAIAYKLEGRKITKRDAIRTMASENRKIRAVVRHIERGMETLEYKLDNKDKKTVGNDLEKVTIKINRSEEMRHQIDEDEDEPDEPIVKAIYPGANGPTDPAIWQDYQARFTNGSLHVDAKQFTVASATWTRDDMIEVMLHQHPSKFFVAPLKPVNEIGRADEIQVGDIAVLAGHYMIIAVRGEGASHWGYVMTNYLRINSVDAGASQTRRGRNRRAQMEPPSTAVFV